MAFHAETISAADALASPHVVSKWKRLLSLRFHVNALYASPEWTEHLTKVGGNDIRVVVLRNSRGEIEGLSPLRTLDYFLPFAIGNRSIVQCRWPVDEVLGSELIASDNIGTRAALFEALFQASPRQALYFDAAPLESYDSVPLFTQDTPPSAFVYLIDGPRPWRLVKLAATFDDYLRGMNSKTRSTLRRKVRLLNDRAGGRLEFRAVADKSQVLEFLEQASAVSRKSWQHRVLGPRIGTDELSRRNFEDLATRRLLRAYLLMAGDTPCAFVVGYQYDNVYHYAELAYDEDFADSSPGTVLLYRLLEDLHERRPPGFLNFGVGDASYKLRFGNVDRIDATCVIVNKSARNRLVLGSHRAFNAAIRISKQIIGRRVRK